MGETGFESREDALQQIRLRNERLEWREIDDELVALEVESSLYLAANPAATLLWRLLAEGATRATLCEALVNAYAIDADAAGRDVDAFLDDARDLGLLDES